MATTEVYSSLYKGKVHITTKFSSSHKGLDLGNYKTRNPIYSPNKLGNGRVTRIETSYTSSGTLWKDSLVVWITYDTGYVMSLYHGYVNDKVVNIGDKVVVGQQIYRTGNTGHSTGDHLHCAITKNGTYVDPEPLVINDKTEQPPQDPVIPQEPTECEKEIERLTIENNRLAGALVTSQRDMQLALDRVKVLEDNIKMREDEIRELEVNLDRVTEERNRFENEKNELLMQGTLTGAKTGAIFAELWKRITRSIK